jgi:hypothetical protein
MGLTETKAISLVKKQKCGDVLEIYGPFAFGGARIWEIWVDDGTEKDPEFETRFIVEEEPEPLYFDTFAALSMHLNEVYANATRAIGAFDLTRTRELADLERKKITLYVGAFVFTTTVIAMLYLVVWRGETQSLVTLSLLGLISSGAVLFFGQWFPISNRFGGADVEITSAVSGVTQRRSARANWNKRSVGAKLPVEAGDDRQVDQS